MAQWDGDLIGGNFVTAGGQTVNRIARWQSNLTGACCINGVAIQTFADDCAAVGGVFHEAGVASSEVECAPFCLADLNGDGVVDVSDLLQLLSAWGICP